MQIVTILEPLKNYFKLRKQKFYNQRAQTEIIPIKKVYIHSRQSILLQIGANELNKGKITKKIVKTFAGREGFTRKA